MRNIMKSSIVVIPLLLFSCTKEKTIDQELKEAAANMNKLAPQVLNDGIRLDSTSAGPDKVFKYNYTLLDDVKENVSQKEIDDFKKDAKKGALNAIKTSSEMKEFRDNDVTLKYIYYDKNGKHITDFSVVPSEYKSK